MNHQHARGTFEVNLSPFAPDGPAGEAVVNRMAIDKQFSGELQAVSRGQMLAVGTTVEGSAGYVAIERVTGRLHDREGSFILQHNGLMARGEGSLTITVVPDSGTGELAGLTGTMTIEITEGVHFYDLTYTLNA